VVAITITIEGSKMCLEYHIFRHPGSTFILVGVPLHALLRGTDNGECLKMTVGHQEFLTSFTRTVNHAAKDELEENLHQQVMATTLEEELSPSCLDNVADYFSGGGVTAWGRHLEVLSGGRRWRDAVVAWPSSGGAGGR
jgi:hypothetical protein